MNIEATKLEIMEMLLHTQKEAVLMRIKSVFQEESFDWWNELTSEEQKEIEIGLTEAENEKGINHTEAMQRFKKWK